MGIVCCKYSNIKVLPKKQSDIIISEIGLNSAHNEMVKQNPLKTINSNEFSNYNDESSHLFIHVINHESSNNNNNNVNQICRACGNEILGQLMGIGICELISAIINCAN